MENRSLKKVVAAIYDMELNNYLMTRAIQSLNEELRHSPVYEKNSGWGKPIKPNKPMKRSGAVESACYGAVFGAIAGVVIKFVLGLINYLVEYNSVSPELQGEVVDRAPGLIFGGSWSVVLIVVAIGAAIGFICGISEAKQYKAECAKYEADLKQYELDEQEYRTHIKQRDMEISARKTARKEALTQQKKILSDKLYDSNRILADLYNAAGIDENYRNIVPIGYMNDFLKLGIASKLEGADGLYYLIRKELRMDQMTYKLDTIISKLDTLIDQQHSIYGELIRINNKCDNLITGLVQHTDALLQQNHLLNNRNALLAKIESNTAMAAYNAERIAKEQEYQSYMVRYQSW